MSNFNFDNIGASGPLEAALDAVNFELMKVDIEEANRLAVEVHKAWVLAAAIDRQTSAMNRIAEAIEALKR